MDDDVIELPRPYHEAVLHWQRHNFPDYPLLSQNWERFFPTDPPFCLCARFEPGGSETIEVGERAGQPKATRPAELDAEAARTLLAIVRAQASTEFGSIQQHQDTLERAPDDELRAWVLRVMAEELRHGYQMLHLLLSADWSAATDQKPADIVEEILSMRTGSHVLGAFNVEFDSFVDNVVFAAFIDRVGKYQLTMQRVCAYRPMAQSMPPMLREEAFHLAAGVIPLRRWVDKAARGDPLIGMPMLQKAINKWFPRALEMFGHEKGGDTVVRLGLKELPNAEAQARYVDECAKLVEDLNRRFVRARLGDRSRAEADAIAEDLLRGGRRHVEISPEELLRLPDRRFFRRRGEPAFEMVGVAGERFSDVDAYVAHLGAHLPEAYLASRDLRQYVETLRQVVAGELSVADAVRRTPQLARVGGTCPCAKSVRWVVDEA